MLRRVVSPVVGKMVQTFGEDGTAAIATAAVIGAGMWYGVHTLPRKSTEQISDPKTIVVQPSQPKSQP